MSDLTSKDLLSTLRDYERGGWVGSALAGKAADEIERLRRDVKLLEIVGSEHERRIAELKRTAHEPPADEPERWKAAIQGHLGEDELWEVVREMRIEIAHLRTAGTEGAANGAVLDAGKVPAGDPETVTIRRKDAEFCVGMLRGAMTVSPHNEVVWRRIRSALTKIPSPVEERAARLDAAAATGNVEHYTAVVQSMIDEDSSDGERSEQ